MYRTSSSSTYWHLRSSRSVVTVMTTAIWLVHDVHVYVNIPTLAHENQSKVITKLIFPSILISNFLRPLLYMKLHLTLNIKY